MIFLVQFYWTVSDRENTPKSAKNTDSKDRDIYAVFWYENRHIKVWSTNEEPYFYRDLQ